VADDGLMLELSALNSVVEVDSAPRCHRSGADHAVDFEMTGSLVDERSLRLSEP
jgi:hypothetical protein